MRISDQMPGQAVEQTKGHLKWLDTTVSDESADSVFDGGGGSS